MSSNAPAQQRDRSAPYSQTFTTAQASLTNLVVTAVSPGNPRVAPYQNACSGLLVVPLTAAATRVDWTDCAGTVNSIAFTAPASGVGIPIYIPVGAIALPNVTNCSVTVLWHGTGNGLAAG